MSFVPLSSEEEDLVSKVYETYPFGRDRLRDAVLAKHPEFKGSRRAILYWLKNQSSWQTQNKPNSNRSTIAPLQITKPGYLQLDNVSMRTYPDNGYIGFTHMIDGFTKKSWARPLRTEEEKETVDAIESMLDQMQQEGKKVTIIQSDNGSTFQARYRALLDKRGIKYTYSAPARPQANSFIERRGGDIKAALYRLMELHGDKRWVMRFQGVIDSINNSKSFATGVTPNSLENAGDEMQQKVQEKIASNLASRYKTKKMMRPLYVGQQVRARRVLQSSVKKPGLLGYWNKEVLTVVQRLNSTYANFLPSYRLANANGDVLKGRYARTDLLEIPPILSRDIEEADDDLDDLSDEDIEDSNAPQDDSLVHNELVNRGDSEVAQVPQVPQVQVRQRRKSLRISNANNDEEEAEYEIGFLLSKRRYRGRVEYKVRYLGYTSDSDEWRGERELIELAPELVEEYNALH
ncbi:TPA_asm: integrase [Powellomyces chytrid fungus MELD virus 6]|nr:TPA_asm: integrase [Powellomyces chytrid fungus MELD virus 6]